MIFFFQNFHLTTGMVDVGNHNLARNWQHDQRTINLNAVYDGVPTNIMTQHNSPFSPSLVASSLDFGSLCLSCFVFHGVRTALHPLPVRGSDPRRTLRLLW